MLGKTQCMQNEHTGGSLGYFGGKKQSKKKRPSWYGVPEGPIMTAFKRPICASQTLTYIVSVEAWRKRTSHFKQNNIRR